MKLMAVAVFRIPTNVSVRTAAPPSGYRRRVFESTAAANFDSKINHGTPMKGKYFRCRNNNDIVTRVPALPYKHVGTEIYLDRL